MQKVAGIASSAAYFLWPTFHLCCQNNSFLVLDIKEKAEIKLNF